MQVSITPEFAARLRKVVKISGGGNTYELERALDEDLLLTLVGWANSYYANDTYNPGGDSYTEVSRHPLADASAAGAYRAPDPDRPELYAESDWVLRTFKDK